MNPKLQEEAAAIRAEAERLGKISPMLKTFYLSSQNRAHIVGLAEAESDRAREAKTAAENAAVHLNQRLAMARNGLHTPALDRLDHLRTISPLAADLFEQNNSVNINQERALLESLVTAARSELERLQSAASPATTPGAPIPLRPETTMMTAVRAAAIPWKADHDDNNDDTPDAA